MVSPVTVAAAATPDKQLLFTITDYGNNVAHGPEGKNCWLVQNAGEWKWVSNQYAAGRDHLPLPAGCDLKRDTLVVIDYGLATSAVHLYVDDVFRSKDGLVVETALRMPAQGVESGGKAHRLLQVVRCAKTAGPLIVRVRYQEYDSLGFIRDKTGPLPTREILLRGTEPGSP
ncbi:MAG: hypothetical protein K2W95_28155 [Candidatus Obscuribacterales bacterium]|nr:hypothetical protein [Candidatus Obscuribacterales bacterium]